MGPAVSNPNWRQLTERGTAATSTKPERRYCPFLLLAGKRTAPRHGATSTTDSRVGCSVQSMDSSTVPEKTIIAHKFDLTFGFSEGLAAVQISKKWGYVRQGWQDGHSAPGILERKTFPRRTSRSVAQRHRNRVYRPVREICLGALISVMTPRGVRAPIPLFSSDSETDFSRLTARFTASFRLGLILSQPWTADRVRRSFSITLSSGKLQFDCGLWRGSGSAEAESLFGITNSLFCLFNSLFRPLKSLFGFESICELNHCGTAPYANSRRRHSPKIHILLL